MHAQRLEEAPEVENGMWNNTQWAFLPGIRRVKRGGLASSWVAVIGKGHPCSGLGPRTRNNSSVGNEKPFSASRKLRVAEKAQEKGDQGLVRDI